MTRYTLLRTPDAALTADSPLVRADDAARLGDLAELIAAIEAERAALPAAFDAARAEGMAEGRALGTEEGRRAAMDEGSARFAEALSGLAGRRAEGRDEAADLAFAIARRVLPQALGDALLPRLIETAAAELQDEQPQSVRVPPAEVDGVRAALSGTGLRVEGDDTLTDDQAVLVTATGSAEAGLEARLSVLMEAMRG